MKKRLGAAFILAAALGACSSSDKPPSQSGPPPVGQDASADDAQSGGGADVSVGVGDDAGGTQPPGSDSGPAPGDDAAPGDASTPGTGDDAGPGTGDAGAVTPTGDGGWTTGTPLLGLLSQFTAPDVPMQGPKESPPIARSWVAPATPPMHPGNGLAQHPMLYAGEGFNEIFLVNEGKVIWTYNTAPGGEIDDVWMLTNGHIMYAHLNYLEELTPKKEVVWHYDLPAGTESHSLQPIGLDKVLFAQNGQPANIVVMNKADNSIVVKHTLTDAGAVTHPQFRRMRMTAAGTYLAPYLEAGKVVEFDKDFNVIWTYPVAGMGTPWTALRLHNGNTLIQDERNKTSREVNSTTGAMVWQFAQTDLPVGLTQSAPQTSERLANGNTVILSPGKNVNSIQAVEVNAAKQVVWVLQDWKDLGPATTAQFLDQPGIPENPGDLMH